MKEKDGIKVSVIIYVKNTVDYIEQCIQSVMNQTLREIEILVIDGGSTDGTLEIVKKMKKMDERIFIFHSTASVGAQFNLGLRAARGQYIAVCEADDYILPEMYERQYQIADKHQIDVIRAGYYQIFCLNGKEYRFKLKACDQDEWLEKEIFFDKNTFFLEQGINGFWNGLYRKQFLLDNDIWMNETKGAAYQDISFSFLTQMYAKKVWFMEDAFYCYRIDNPNASVNSFHGVELHIREYEELKKRLKNSNQWEKYKNIFFSWELISYRWFLGELPDELKKENAEKVYDYLKTQREKERYDAEKVMEAVNGLAQTLPGSKTDFIQYILSGNDGCRNLLKYIENYLEHDRMVILFGAGHMGQILKQFFEYHNKEVFLMDNDRFLQKNGLMGKMVYIPEDIVTYFPDKKYIIANICHAEEMKEQLLMLGIQEENILICDNEEFFLRRIFAKAGNYGK